MSGGRLVVMDRAGRDVKRFPLGSGLATLGSAAACDIRVLLPSVSGHHATVTVHQAQTVIRNVGDGETFVNGQSIGVAALQHGDIITLGDRSLRWEYSAPNKRQQASVGTVPQLLPRAAGRGARGARRGSAGPTPAARDRALQLAIEMTHRASMPASSGGKQVAIVQPQRRDTNVQTVSGGMGGPRASQASGKRRSKAELDSSIDSDSDIRRTRLGPKTVPSNTTQATLWIESRKPRRALSAGHTRAPAPLRLAVLRKAQSAHKHRVLKIQAPLKIDHTKQAAIMLMTGHTPKSRVSLSQAKKRPSYVIKKPSPVRQSAGRRGRRSDRGEGEGEREGDTPKRASTYSDTRRSQRGEGNQSVTILEITDSTRASSVATRSSKSPQKSPSLLSPKKSALKDLSKKGNRKTESIKFDLSNLENHQESEITSRFDSEDSMSEDDLTLHYSESSNQSPSPRKSINSRSGRMLEKLGTSVTLSPSRTLTPNSPSSRRSGRSSMIVRKALDNSEVTDNTKTDNSANATLASAFRTRTLSPRTRNLESYSIVDLVSIDSDTSKSVYNSADSANSTDYGTPNATGRKTRSSINPTLLGCSTPYVAQPRATRSRSGPGPDASGLRDSVRTRRSKSLTTPENKHVSINSTRVSRASRSRSRINDSDLLLLDHTELEDSSPKTSRRTRTKSNIVDNSKIVGSPAKDGTTTPESRRSPVEVGTPVLSIQSLLDSSQSSLRSRASVKKGRPVNYKRKTIGGLPEPRRRAAAKSRSLGGSARQTVLRLSKDSSEASDRTEAGAPQPDNDDTVTPKSAVKLIPEAVKNKHSTAKKPQSKRSIIDDLNQSDIVKQLFNSPVKRKLSQSMTEFSRRQLFEDDEIVIAKRPTRNTIAVAGRSLDELSEPSDTFTPERFVSPISTRSPSPNLSGIKRLFQNNTPENDLNNVRGVRSLLRTHRTRRSAKNDLSNVTGLKLMFANTPKNRLSDVRVKEVFKPSPNNNLRRVSGVKSLFQRERLPKNDLSDVRGVKKLFRKSPNNDLRNVSGVKRTLRNSPRNDLSDVRGVRKMFRNNRNKESHHDVSGIEELFNTSAHSSRNSESLFDQLVGKAPPVKAVYSKTFSTKLIQKPKPKTRKAKSLHNSLEGITDNVEEWLEHELQKRFHREEPSTSKLNYSRNATKELNNLATSTVQGGEPVRASRTRNSSMIKKSASETYSAHTLPIKKRSLVDAAEMSKPMLPIKKRAVVHSTPVKGRVDVTMNASELGRVSPIAPVENTHGDHDSSLTRSTRQKVIPEEPKSRVSKAKTPQKTPTRLSAKVSPKQASPRPSAKNTKAATPKASPKKVEKTPPKRVTRNRKNTTSDNTKKRQSSLVIGKKAPVMSPKVDPKKSTKIQENTKKRVTRGQKGQKIETPKRTRVKAQKATVLVPKPSPKLKPQAQSEEPQLEGKTRRTRKNTAAEVDTEAPKESQPRATRGKQNVSKGKENKTDNVDRPKRGRKVTDVEVEPPATKRGRPKQTNVQEVKTRGKSVTKADSKSDDKQPKTRGKKVEVQLSIEPEATTRRGRKNIDNVSLETQPKTRGKKVEALVENEPKTRGKKVETQSSVQSEPTTRGRRTKAVDNTVIPETTGRKRKTIAVEEVPAKITRTTRRGKKAEPVQTEVKAEAKDTGKTRPAKDKSESKEDTKTRGRAKKVEVVKEAPAKATRGKKAAEPKEIPETDKRKRKTKVEASPAKGKKVADAKKARSEPSPRPRAARGQTQEVSAASGRSRRR